MTLLTGTSIRSFDIVGMQVLMSLHLQYLELESSKDSMKFGEHIVHLE